MATHILLVEDDRDTRQMLAAALREEGFVVSVAERGSAADRALAQGEIAAVILDVGLPDGSGVDLCQKWRRAGIRTPVLMLTARTDVASRVGGLDAGADDYLGKPFSLAELKARLRALLRRRPPDAGREKVLTRGPVVVDFGRRQAWLSGLEVPITRRENEVLERLAAGRGRVVSRDDLLEELWGEATRASAASLEVIVARLRRKLERQGQPLIRTVRGQGYALAGEGDEPRS